MIYYSLQFFTTAELYLHSCGSMKTENHMCHIIQNSMCRQGQRLQGGWRKSDTGCEEHGREGWRKGGGGERKASEDKQGERLGSLVRCGEGVLGKREKGGAPEQEGEYAAELIHFRAVNLNFPRGNLWLCNVGNSLFADLRTEPPEHQIIVKEGRDFNSPQ